MARYFLDTHIVAWIITDSSKVNEDLMYDLMYPSGNKYITSEYVILELMHLKQLGKIKLQGTAKKLFSLLQDFGIELEFISDDVFEELEKLPLLTIEGKQHTDMMDRIIIAHSIANHCTLISQDRKFPHYRKYGLKLING